MVAESIGAPSRGHRPPGKRASMWSPVCEPPRRPRVRIVWPTARKSALRWRASRRPTGVRGSIPARKSISSASRLPTPARRDWSRSRALTAGPSAHQGTDLAADGEGSPPPYGNGSGSALAGPGVAGMALQLPHPVELLPLSEWDRVPPRVLVGQRDDRGQSGRTCDVAARGAGAREAVVFLYGIGGPFRALVNRAVPDDEAARIAKELAAGVVEDEVIALALGADPVLVDDRVYFRCAGHAWFPHMLVCVALI
jgi:hypothetical protein